MIDWRSDFAGDRAVGDRYYDLAKFLHTLDLSVSAMDRGAYALEVGDLGISITHDDDAVRSEARDLFWNFVSSHGYNGDRIAIINGLIFVNMAPLYTPRMADYLYHLGRLRLENAIISATS